MEPFFAAALCRENSLVCNSICGSGESVIETDIAIVDCEHHLILASHCCILY